MMSNNSSSRTGPESPPTRAEPREPRPEPREARTEARTPPPAPPRASELKTTDVRTETRSFDARVAEAPRTSVLGATLRFRGELSAQEDLIVQGSVEGSITHTQTLTIGAEGSMKGDIRARVIIIDGKVDGDLYATELINIRATAKVKGNVFAPRVGITEGAFFQGQVEMQPSGAAVQEHSARMRQAALAAPVLDGTGVNQILSNAS